MKNENIDTERLILRPLQIIDSKQMLNNLVSSEKVTKFLTWSPHYDIDSVKASIAKKI
ncbi:hypothetical protein DOK78_002034 [Enterococcus sp. DIV2402]|uniref:N-acetyltransferase domain-containing protein n=1 Tax=Candidatus Enterococcus lowellii TaxID=2230877 RepID=A0ABZ2SQJ2_9ENTE|nr:hypothetical protein [Enterococcus sp. DIV2402]MBO0463840.1 hypothetical protein [Enterococcus sp. DIV2402]